MNRFCIITNTDKDGAVKAAVEIKKYLSEKKCVCVDATKEHAGDENRGYADVEKIPDNTECIVILGGDGTIIHAACDIAGLDIPVLGINMGTLGYLADTEENEIYGTLDKLIRDEYEISSRMMMRGIVRRGNDIIYEGDVLNDIVVGRNGFSRIISLNIYVNDELTETLRGDGIIIATPTGSTGYNLSAGGPVIKPNSNVLVITPICAHSMSSTSIVVSSEDKIAVEIIKSMKSREMEAIASFDGGQGTRMDTGDIIEIEKSEFKTKLISTRNHGYFEVLHKKLAR